MKQAGFTLIELLTVIAIIAVLAATVLSSLGDARQQGIEAKIQTEMDAITKRAEIEQVQFGTYDVVCGSNSATQSTVITRQIASINNLASTTVVCNSGPSSYALSVGLEDSHWCVDSLGERRELSDAITTELACP